MSTHHTKRRDEPQGKDACSKGFASYGKSSGEKQKSVRLHPHPKGIVTQKMFDPRPDSISHTHTHAHTHTHTPVDIC